MKSTDLNYLTPLVFSDLQRKSRHVRRRLGRGLGNPWAGGLGGRGGATCAPGVK